MFAFDSTYIRMKTKFTIYIDARTLSYEVKVFIISLAVAALNFKLNIVMNLFIMLFYYLRNQKILSPVRMIKMKMMRTRQKQPSFSTMQAPMS